MIRCYCAEHKPWEGDTAREHLRRQQFDLLDPTYINRRMVRGKIKEVEQPLFPGYLLILFDLAVEKICTACAGAGLSRRFAFGSFTQRTLCEVCAGRGRIGWQAINGTRGIKRLYGGERPLPLPARVVAELSESCAAGPFPAESLPAEMTKLIRAGQTVRVTAGPFEGFLGPCTWARGERIQVLLSFLGGARNIPMRAGMVEAVG